MGLQGHIALLGPNRAERGLVWPNEAKLGQRGNMGLNGVKWGQTGPNKTTVENNA